MLSHSLGLPFPRLRLPHCFPRSFSVCLVICICCYCHFRGFSRGNDACLLSGKPAFFPLPLHLQERPVYLAWRAQYRISPTATVIDSEGTQLESKRFGEILLKPLDHRHMPFRFRRKAKNISGQGYFLRYRRGQLKPKSPWRKAEWKEMGRVLARVHNLGFA